MLLMTNRRRKETSSVRLVQLADGAFHSQLEVYAELTKRMSLCDAWMLLTMRA